MRAKLTRQSWTLPVLLLGIAASIAAAGAAELRVSGQQPPSFRIPLLPAERLATADLPRLDIAALMAEDETAPKDIAFRVGLAGKTDLSPANAGTWEPLPDGSQLWRLRLRSRDALWLVAGLTTYRLQPGAELWIYTADRATVLGPFTAADIRPHGQLWFPPLAGREVVLELLWPAKLAGEEPNLHLGTVSQGYRPWGGIGDPPGGGEVDSGSCNIDVNCPLGDNWQDEKRGVVNLLRNGSGYCTGSLIANTDGDCTPYVLTANHCLSSNSSAASTTFQFNFERPACGSGIAPTNQTVTGSTLKATYSGSDFTLLLMDAEPPAEYQAFLNGWSRSTAASSASWCIHHPNNDEKAISYNQDPLIDGQNYGSDHWRVTEWEQGTTEPGSSGSPLFDTGHRIVGQLHGGQASCTNITWDEFGKLDVSWNGGGTAASRLRDWLDPSGTGAVTQDGIDQTVCGVPKPKLSYAGHVANDGPGGNGDGVVDPGETIELQVDVSNSGTLDATQVSGLLSTVTPLVTITDDSASWPDIPQGATRRSDPPHFTMQLDAAYPCGDPVELKLDLSALEDPGAWTSNFTVPTGTPQTDQVFADDMESGPGGWNPQTLSGNNPWSQSQADASSPVTSWFVSDIDTVSDSVLQMVTLPALAAHAELRFQHRINSESTYDGGVLEYSTDGASWVDAGPLITSGGYNNTISTSYSSPIGGREAWSGDNGAWQQVTVDLSTLAGADLRLRWRFATDSSVSDVGWYVDDVVVDSTSYLCSPAGPTLPGEASDPSGGGAPFTIAKDPGGYLLSWSAPPAGGAPESYKLYRSPLGAAFSPVCEADLGAGTSAVLATLTDGSNFVVVARNPAGEGPYGSESDGKSRAGAKAGDACP